MLINLLLDLQAAEDPQYSVIAKVELRKVFAKRSVSKIYLLYNFCFQIYLIKTIKL